MILKNKKAAIEMSMTTIVTIVLVVVTLVLALVLIRTIFTSSTNAVTQVNDAIQNQINQLFTSENTNLVIYPESGQITISKGSDPQGVAFSVKNPDLTTDSFSYNLNASDVSNCQGSITADDANGYVIGASSTFSLGPGNALDRGKAILFKIPSNAPPCTILYDLNVNELTPKAVPFDSANIFVTIK